MKRSIASVALALIAGCESPETGNDVPRVVDSGGVRVVTNVDLAGVPVLSVDRAPELHVGWDDGDPAFEAIYSGALFPGGGAAVTDLQAANLIVIEPSGAFNVIGRRGEGPGEFRRLTAVQVLPSGNLFTWDQSLQRATEFDRDGSLVSTVTFPSLGDVTLEPNGMIGEDRIGWIPTGFAVRRRETGADWMSGQLAVTSLNGTTMDTVAAVPMALLEYEDGRPLSIPFMRIGLGGAWRDGFVWTSSDAPQAVWLSPDGDTTQVSHWPSSRQEVSDSVWRGHEALTRERMSDVPEEVVSGRLATQKARATAFLPEFRSVAVAPDGALWLGRFEVESLQSRRFLVLAPDGVVRSWVQFERPVRVLDLSEEMVLVKELDPLGIEAVAVYRLPS